MKRIIISIIFNVIFISLWYHITMSYPPLYFFGSLILYGGLYWITSLFLIRQKKITFIYNAFLYVALLLNDYLIRNYGTGDNDQLGKTLYDLSFTLAFFVLTMSIFVYYYVSPFILNIKGSKIEFTWSQYRKDFLIAFPTALFCYLYFFLFHMESFSF